MFRLGLLSMELSALDEKTSCGISVCVCVTYQLKSAYLEEVEEKHANDNENES